MTTAATPTVVEKIALTMRETCAAVGLSRSTVSRLLAMGQFPEPRRIRGRVLFSAAEVRAWFEAQPKGRGAP